MSLSLTFRFIQGVPKLVTQKCAVVTSELEVTNRSGTIQKLRLVLKFSFKPPDGIPLVQRCLEILPVIMD
jgi:hypothetical protein